MTPEQTAEFEKWYKEFGTFQTHELSQSVWEACVEHLHPMVSSVPSGYFRIGEEVEAFDQDQIGLKFLPGRVVVKLDQGSYVTSSNRVRRRPAWEPKYREAVFVHDLNGDVLVGRIIKVETQEAECIGLKGVVWELPFSAFKPFDPSKIGLPWSSI